MAGGVENIPRLLFPELVTFGLLGGFTVTPPPADRDSALSGTVAQRRGADLDKAPDSPVTRAQREAVGILVSEASAGTDLTALALFHLLQEVRDRRVEGAQPRTLFTLLTRGGLTSADAGRVVVSVLTESGVPRDSLADITTLLAQGKLLAAHQLATTMGGAAGQTAREAVARQREQVENLRHAAATDLRAGRDEQAAARLREALRLAGDSPELANELATVPAAPVLEVTASADGGGVRIAWRPAPDHLAPDHGARTSFRVVRREGGEPSDADDGREIPIKSGHSTIDDAPPVGRRLHYAVFARTAGGPWSRPVCATVQVIPPVTDVVVEGASTVVTGRWRVHPDVAAVEVHRSEGIPQDIPQCPEKPIAVERNRAFRDETAVEGVAYFYTLVACYPPDSGAGALRSAPVVVRGAIRPQARPVTTLTATPAAGAGLAVRLSWRQHPASEIVIRRSPRPCPWEYGQVVARAELASYGAELDGTRTAKGESMTLVAAVAPGRSYCVAFTLDADGAVRGQDAVVDLADPVSRVRAQRFGDDVRVTWRWPDQTSVADVRWAGGSRRITVQQFRDEGGCQIRGVPGVSRVEVGAVICGESGESRSPLTSVDVEARPPQLTYQLRRRGHRLAGGVTCVVTLSATEPVSDVTLIIVAATGHAMPRCPEAGLELLRAPVVIDPAAPLVVTAPIPRLPKPYWLRCFLAEPAPALLLDPPVSQLKVS